MATKQEVLSLLRQALDNPRANFRAGQWEAIEEILQKRSHSLAAGQTHLVNRINTRLLTQV